MAVAYFDLDRTILPVNSAWTWMRFELKQGHITYSQLAEAVGWLTLYHLGFGSLETPLRRAIAVYQGDPASELAERTRRFYEAEIAGRYRPGAHPVLAAHRTAGDELVLLTGSSDWLSALVSEELALDGYLSNRFEIDNQGFLTGNPLTPMSYGQGKVALAARHAAERGFGLRDCAFYTDSHSDQAMLEAVGRPVVVHPDPRLHRLAVRRGWACESWDEPT